ncbi:MAG: ATP-binding protein, partial [Gemmatimonadota bacterium]|nr:ATP-binding protein [Gemmatimonadota bacterium]
GSPRKGRITGSWSLALAAPIKGEDGATEGVVVLGMDLVGLRRLLVRRDLPGGAVVTLTDRESTVISRTRDPERYIGSKAPRSAGYVPPPEEGAGALASAESLEGEEFVWGVADISSVGWQVFAGVPKDQIMGPVRRLVMIYLLVAAVGSFLIFLLAGRVRDDILGPLDDLRERIHASLMDTRAEVPETGPEEVAEVARDFNRTMRAWAEAQSGVKRLSSAVEQSADPVMITDRGGAIVYVNPAFQFVTGYSAAEVRGKSPSVLRSGVHPGTLYQELWTTIRSGSPYPGVFTNRRKDGSLYQEEKTITPVLDEAGEITHFVSSGRDVSAQEELRRKIRETEKLEALWQLARGIAHDLRNVVTVVGGHVQLLALDLEEAEASWGQGSLQEISRGVEMATALAGQLLTFSGTTSAHDTVVSVNEVLGALESFLTGVLPKTVRLSMELDGDVPPVWMDRSRLEQLLMNLVVNARDAMPSGGDITIRTSRTAEGRGVVIEVVDTGEGMDESVRERVFDLFFTTKKEGTGLGLATAHIVVNEAGGTIGVESAPGRGTTFSVVLPATDRVAKIQETVDDFTSSDPAVHRILVVDDVEALGRLARRVLEREGYSVEVGASVQEGLTLARSAGDEFSLVLTDLNLPDGRGTDLYDALRESHPGLRVLFMSGFAGGVDEWDRIVEMGHPVLSKPFAPADLVQEVRQALHARVTS